MPQNCKHPKLLPGSDERSCWKAKIEESLFAIPNTAKHKRFFDTCVVIWTSSGFNGGGGGARERRCLHVVDDASDLIFCRCLRNASVAEAKVASPS